MSKMNWQIEAYRNGTCEYEIQKTKAHKGTVCIPTGGGKSGVMIRDILWHIDHAKQDEKLIFNISAPILNLCSQLAEDLFEVIAGTHKSNCEKGEFAIFINSSAQDKYYATDNAKAVGKTYHFVDLHEAFETNPNARFAIVISCHESLKNFADKLDEMKVYSTILNYLDESHTLINFTQHRDYEFRLDKFTKDESKRCLILGKLLESSYLYAFSATPDKFMTMMINRNGKNLKAELKSEDTDCIINISPMELIHDGVIVAPYFYACQMEEEITAAKVMRFMEICKDDNPHISHKILVSCSDTDHLERLQDELQERGMTVFSTCAKKGAQSNYNSEDADDNGNFVGISQEDFTKEVDGYDKGDCFVLHIRQLRAGIDIRTLTDCVIANNGTYPKEGNKMVYVQTIGRILRPYKGERPEELEKSGKTLADRVKTHGNVLFMIGEGNYDVISSRIARFAISHYGIKNIKLFDFESQKRNEKHVYGEPKEEKPEDDFFKNANRSWEERIHEEIEELKDEIVSYIRETINRKYTMSKLLKGDFDRECSIRMINQKVGTIFGDDCAIMRPIGEMIGDYDLMKVVSDELLAIGIK